MKVLPRIAIILAVAFVVVLGLNWLREHNLLPGQPTLSAGEGFGPRGESRGEFPGEFRGDRARPEGFERNEFRRPGDHRAEGPSLAGSVEMAGTAVKMGLVAAPVVLIDLLARRRRRPSRRRAQS